MTHSLRVLIVEDSDDDAQLTLRALKASFQQVQSERVDTQEALLDRLKHQQWDGLIVDHHLPGLDAFTVLQLIRDLGLDVPTIVVSGSIGEDLAVATMRAGAHDYVMKSSLQRLGPALERELREAEARRKQRESQRQLHKADVQFQTMVRSTSDLIFTLDRNLRYTGVWGRWLEKENHDPAMYLGMKMSELHGALAQEAHHAAATRCLEGGTVSYEWAESAPGGLRHFETSLAPMVEEPDGIVGLVGFRREVTELKNAQAMLAVSDRMVSIGTLAAGVAHEINNPLAAVIADLEFVARALAGSAQSDPVEVLSAVRNAKDASQSIRQIVADLKTFSRPDEEQRGPMDMQHAIESSLRVARNEVRHKARIQKDYGPVPLVVANQARLGQVFLNLLVNAAQAMDSRGPSHNEISIRTYTDAQGWAVVEVKDSGKGIPARDLKRIFDPFYTTKPVGVGTGLGLFVCHRIISELGGELSVESQEGKGATFRVRLAPAANVDVEAQPERAVEAAARRGAVLVVDDEKMIGSAVRRTLEAEHDVTVLTNPQEALTLLLAGKRFDVILCDLMMPQMTGMDLHAEALKHCAEQAAKMVFLTGGAFTPQSQEFLASVPNAHLDKPFDTTELRALVNGRVR
jgi:PAS domain S-box-containing protein